MLDEFFQWIGARSSTIHTIHTISYDLLRSRTISYDLVRSAYDLTYRYVPIPGPFRLHFTLRRPAGPCRIRTAHVNAKRGVSTGENRGSIAGASARVRAVPGRRGVSPRSVGGRAGTRTRGPSQHGSRPWRDGRPSQHGSRARRDGRAMSRRAAGAPGRPGHPGMERTRRRVGRARLGVGSAAGSAGGWGLGAAPVAAWAVVEPERLERGGGACLAVGGSSVYSAR